MAFQLEGQGCTNFLVDERDDPILSLSNRLINLTIPEGEPSIFTAVRYGDIRKIESEIAHNVDLNQTFEDDSYGVQASSMAHRVKLAGYSVIHLAAFHCTPEVFEMLLDSGADKDAVDKQLRTPLHLAAIAGRTSIVKILIRRGAQIDVQSSSGRTPLLEAVFSDDSVLASMLIEAGANIDIQDTKGTSVLHHLCLHRRPNLIFLDYVLSKKCDVDITNPKGSTPLMFACAMKTHFSPKIVKLLLQYGAKINQIDKDGHSAINFVVEHKSAFERTCIILLFLIQHGSSTTHIDKKGMTLLDFAMRNMSLGCMKCLLLSDIQRDAKNIMENPNMLYLFERVPSFKEWLMDELYTPRSLMRLCRQTVRSSLSSEGLLKVDQLDLPQDLQSFIYCKDIQLDKLVT